MQRGLVVVESKDGAVDEGDGQHGRGRLREGAAGEDGMLGFHGWWWELCGPVPAGIGV
jgi:hypothetical protein